jgi:hypothetical protein
MPFLIRNQKRFIPISLFIIIFGIILIAMDYNLRQATAKSSAKELANDISSMMTSRFALFSAV